MSKDTPAGERIAKVIARAGVASRREAEKLIEEGRVTVNGKVIDRAALNVTDKDRIVVDGKPLDAPEEARLWMYHKPAGLVTTTKDEQGRPTIYDDLPEDMPRVVSVGRLDLNSEGLLLLTNDGAVKRQLELPSTGWLRKYRVRVNGRPTEEVLEPLRRGIEVDGIKYQPMIVSLDRQQGANAWLTVGLREGKNREIRRAMTDIGLTVNRLIRVSYGPFQLGQLKQGEVEEVRRKVVRDQLGLDADMATKPEGEARTGLRKTVSHHGGTTKSEAGKPGSDKAAAGRPGGKAPGGRVGAGKPGTGRSGDSRTGEGRTGGGKIGTGKPGTGRAGSGKAGDSKAGADKPFAGKGFGGKGSRGKAAPGKAGHDPVGPGPGPKRKPVVQRQRRNDPGRGGPGKGS